MNISEEAVSIHHGRNIRIFRKAIEMKQEVLAKKMTDLGARQQDVSRLEQMPVIEDDILNIVAKALNVDVKLIKEFDPNAAIEKICIVKDNVFHDQSTQIGQQIVNPSERMIEVYERLIESEKEKYRILNDSHEELRTSHDSLVKQYGDVVKKNEVLAEKNVELLLNLNTVMEKIAAKL